MNSDREEAIAEFEHERNASMDSYFSARPHIERTIDIERIFEAGFRMAWELLFQKAKIQR